MFDDIDTQHEASVEDALAHFQTPSIDAGLTSDEANARLQKNGPNEAVPKKKKKKKKSAMDAFAAFLPNEVEVVRDGSRSGVSSRDLVVGDIVYLRAGDKTPADIRVVKVEKPAAVDKSALTGECEPVKVTTEGTHSNPLETRNISFHGNLVVEGSMYGVVFATGWDTVMNRISGFAAPVAPEQSFHSYDKRFKGISGKIFMAKMAKRVMEKNMLVKTFETIPALANVTCVVTDHTGTLTQNCYSVANVFLNYQMHLPESLSRDDIGMQVLEDMFIHGTRASFLEEDVEGVDEPRVAGDASETALLRYVAASRGGKPAIVREAREARPAQAWLHFTSSRKYMAAVVDSPLTDKLFAEGNKKKEKKTPSKSSKRKSGVQANDVGKGEMPVDGPAMYFKGAPDRIIRLCTHALIDGEILPIDGQRAEAASNEAQLRGRALGFAMCRLGDGFKVEDGRDEQEFLEEQATLHGLVFVGITVFLDPPRSGLAEALADLREMSIPLVITASDPEISIREFARRNSLYEDLSQVLVVGGNDVQGLSHEQWAKVAEKGALTYRLTPKDRLGVVEALQEQGAVVCYVGDGVNDSPALKCAQVGVALGIMGSDVAKEAADVILLDDNLVSIVECIKYAKNAEKKKCIVM